MDRNYNKKGMFHSPGAMQKYIAQGKNSEEWIKKTIQGKGYEWDWMSKQRSEITNLLKQYNAGDIHNRPGSDVTEKCLLNGNSKEYQMKAITSNGKPDLKTTPKNMSVVINKEKVRKVRDDGYNIVEEFGDTNSIQEATGERLEKAKRGNAQTAYSLKNIAHVAASAGLMSCVIGMGTEAVTRYREWKVGYLNDKQYLKEIMKAGGDAGITGGATAAIMVPVAAKVTVAGLSTWITVPVAIVVGGVVNKVVAPCFGRGEYKTILADAKYYQTLENVYDDLINSIQTSTESYHNFLQAMNQNNMVYQNWKECSKKIDEDLQRLYESI